jgi:hypothetical protein
MATSILSLGGPAARRRPGPTRTLGTPREPTNGAPCLGLAVIAGGSAWTLLGSVLVLLLT